MAENICPPCAYERDLHGNARLGCEGQGQGSTGPGGGRFSSHRVDGRVREGIRNLAGQGSGQDAPAPGREPPPAQWPPQVRDLPQGPHRSAGEERPVCLLRLSVAAEEGPGNVRCATTQRSALRAAHRRATARAHPHGAKHPAAGEAGERGAGQRRPGAARPRGGGRGGTGRGAPADGPSLACSGNVRPGDQRHSPAPPATPGASGKAGCCCRRGESSSGKPPQPSERGAARCLRPGDERVPDGERTH